MINKALDNIFSFIDMSSEEVLGRAKTLVRYFFYFYAFYIARTIVTFENLIDDRAQNFDPHWVIGWANNLSFVNSVYIVEFLAIASALLALIFYQNRLVRVFVFLSFTQIQGVFNSFGSPNHELYTLLYTLFFLSLLPNVWDRKTKENSKKFLLYIWGAQSFVLLVYTMVGANKVISSVNQWVAGDVGFLSPQGLSTMIAHKLAKFDSYAVLSDLIVNNYWIGWIGAWISVYILLFAVVAAFRPNLHRLWGFLLVSYHISTFLTLGLGFVVFLGVDIFLILSSPFYDPETDWREVVKDLPIFGFLVRRLAPEF